MCKLWERKVNGMTSESFSTVNFTELFCISVIQKEINIFFWDVRCMSPSAAFHFLTNKKAHRSLPQLGDQKNAAS